ncbi:MAG: hypothetical protein MI863_27160 [Desulfobacterales bacterium]|nr:hypothetical protein [Desulfobacterales bacterium]
MKKVKLKYFVILLVLLLSACSHKVTLERKYLGKQVDLETFKKMYESGNHRWHSESLAIEYEYSIDNESKTMTLDGTVTYIVPIEKRKYISEQVLLEYEHFTLILLFADDSGEILSIESPKIKPGQYLVDPFEFKVTVPYKNNLDYILLSYSYRALG